MPSCRFSADLTLLQQLLHGSQTRPHSTFDCPRLSRRCTAHPLNLSPERAWSAIKVVQWHWSPTRHPQKKSAFSSPTANLRSPQGETRSAQEISPSIIGGVKLSR